MIKHSATPKAHIYIIYTNDLFSNENWNKSSFYTQWNYTFVTQNMGDFKYKMYFILIEKWFDNFLGEPNDTKIFTKKNV